MTARGSESLWGNNLGTFDDPERVQPQFVESKLSCSTRLTTFRALRETHFLIRTNALPEE